MYIYVCDIFVITFSDVTEILMSMFSSIHYTILVPRKMHAHTNRYKTHAHILGYTQRHVSTPMYTSTNTLNMHILTLLPIKLTCHNSIQAYNAKCKENVMVRLAGCHLSKYSCSTSVNIPSNTVKQVNGAVVNKLFWPMRTFY